MGHMNDFFGEPLFKPTGTDWIDHAFTAAVLDDMEREERARHSFEFAALTSAAKSPVESDNLDMDGEHMSDFDFDRGRISFRDFVEQHKNIALYLSKCEGFILSFVSNNAGSLIAPLGRCSPLFIRTADDRDSSDILRILIEDLLSQKDREIKIRFGDESEPDEDELSARNYIITITNPGDMERTEDETIPVDVESEVTTKAEDDTCTICTIYGKEYDLFPVFPFEPRDKHGEAIATIERITGLSHGDAMKLELRICQLGFIPLEYPDPS